MGFSGGSAGRESTCTVGDLDSIPGLGRSPGEGKGYPLQYSGLENSMNCIVHGVRHNGGTFARLVLERENSVPSGTCPSSVSSWSRPCMPAFRSDQIRSVAQLCPTLCDPMNSSTPGLPVHHQTPGVHSDSRPLSQFDL